MKRYLTVLLIAIVTQLSAQNSPKKFDVKFGVGTSLLGSGDMTTLNFENEVNYNISNYFSSSFTLNYGRSNSGVYETVSYIQGNLNVFISPFKNTGKNDFRIGTGFSVMNVSESYYFEPSCGVGSDDSSPYHFDNRYSLGYNVIIENNYSISNRFIIGLKLFTQPYFNDDINSGIILKLGLRL